MRGRAGCAGRNPGSFGTNAAGLIHAFVVRLGAAILVGLALAAPGYAESWLALVIGNDAYRNIDQLKKAANDARAIAQSLTKLGFAVTLAENLTRRDFVRSIAIFEGQIKPGAVAFVFYAGHGVEIDGANYLMPVDVPKVAPGQQGILKDESISTDSLIQRLKARGTKAQILVLDACRENPFRDLTGRSIGGSRGLAPAQASSGVFILYSAGIGEVALDRLTDADANPNSVFTRTLVPLLETPNLSMVTIAKEARAKVKSLAGTVGHVQSPAYYDEIDGHLFLARGDGATPHPPAPPWVVVQPTPPAPSPPPVVRLDPAPNVGTGFVFPDSDGLYLTAADLRLLSREQLRIARNEIYARRGRFFRDDNLRAHFSRFSWYRPHSWDVSLNAVERANVRLIQSMER